MWRCGHLFKLSPLRVGAKYLAEWENQVVSNRLEEKGLIFCVCKFPPMRLTWKGDRVKVYWGCWSDWGSSLSAIHMSLGRVSPHVRLTSARKSTGVG